MKIVWDPAKCAANREKQGLDFAHLDPAFFEAAVTGSAGKGREMAIGPFASQAVVVVFQRLGSEGISVISMRPASRKERKLYNEA